MLPFCYPATATPVIYTLSLHDALPIWRRMVEEQLKARGIHDVHVLRIMAALPRHLFVDPALDARRSEEHTSELQSRRELVCRLLLEKKKSRAAEMLRAGSA